ncbi:hypothetical protein FE257_005821 [Aspergillus nanangensis]|uniref:RING-type domain-containing protein n=1 Tax=Aspergillus nanangensis TaxID=2582783 RepID=A0AAD4CA18_ASPNN|nr:hypothetical protein FE257_005821 [Aspergillus nanangensis]
MGDITDGLSSHAPESRPVTDVAYNFDQQDDIAQKFTFLVERITFLENRIEIEDGIRHRLVRTGPIFCHSCHVSPLEEIFRTPCSHLLCGACLYLLDEARETSLSSNISARSCPLCWQSIGPVTPDAA